MAGFGPTGSLPTGSVHNLGDSPGPGPSPDLPSFVIATDEDSTLYNIYLLNWYVAEDQAYNQSLIAEGVEQDPPYANAPLDEIEVGLFGVFLNNWNSSNEDNYPGALNNSDQGYLVAKAELGVWLTNPYVFGVAKAELGIWLSNPALFSTVKAELGVWLSNPAQFSTAKAELGVWISSPALFSTAKGELGVWLNDPYAFGVSKAELGVWLVAGGTKPKSWLFVT